MKKPSAKLEAIWRRKLAQSGFQDLEGTDRDGPLSNRGKLHDGTGKSASDVKASGSVQADADWENFAHRVDTGAEHTDWAMDVLNTIYDDKNPTLRARIWRGHAQGLGLRQIARVTGVNFHVARDAVNATIKEFRCERKPNLHLAILRADTRLLEHLARALVRGLA